MPLEELAVIIALDEGRDHFSGLLEGFEVVQVDAFLLQGPDEALRDAVALRFADIGGCRADTGPPNLRLVLLRPVLRAQVVPKRETEGGRFVYPKWYTSQPTLS